MGTIKFHGNKMFYDGVFVKEYGKSSLSKLMTQEQRQETLYRHLQKLVYEVIYPDGIPLEFGCQIVKGQGSIIIEEDKNIYTIIETDGFKCYVLENNHNNNQYIKGESATILGKPLELQFILFAIRKKYSYQLHGDDLYIEFDPLEEELVCTFDLSKPIQEQDEETLQSLIALLQ